MNAPHATDTGDDGKQKTTVPARSSKTLSVALLVALLPLVCLAGWMWCPGGDTTAPTVTSTDPTLDAQGDAGGVFILQMASTLTTTAGRQVILCGGANAANIYWQVGTSATLGANSVFQGNILADQSIALTSGATLNGRALTKIGAVTLDSNIVTIPSP